MLLILVGATLNVGIASRSYFAEKGYTIINKLNYRPVDLSQEHLDTLISIPEEEVDQCDFVYSIHGGKTGFNKEQIMDAVWGRTNAMMTMSPDNLDFIREIKASFGDYIQTIYLYIDEKSLETITREYITNEENVAIRLQTGRDLRQLYLNNIALFDKTVIFSTNGIFGMDALYRQYDVLIEQAAAIQKRLNDQQYVELPYTGKQDYIFVSYSHKDSSVVMPYLSSLQRDGYRVWYDAGINKGANWRIFVGERLEGCTNFLLFSSQNATVSKNVQAEVSAVLDCDKCNPIILRLDQAEFPTGYQMYLNNYQHIHADEDNVLAKIESALNPSTKVS